MDHKVTDSTHVFERAYISQPDGRRATVRVRLTIDHDHRQWSIKTNRDDARFLFSHSSAFTMWDAILECMREANTFAAQHLGVRDAPPQNLPA